MQVDLWKIIGPFSLVSLLLSGSFKLQLEAYFLECMYSMQYNKSCSNGIDSLGTVLIILIWLKQFCILIPILEYVHLLPLASNVPFSAFPEGLRLIFLPINYDFSIFKSVISNINKFLKPTYIEIWACQPKQINPMKHKTKWYSLLILSQSWKFILGVKYQETFRTEIASFEQCAYCLHCTVC